MGAAKDDDGVDTAIEDDAAQALSEAITDENKLGDDDSNATVADESAADTYVAEGAVAAMKYPNVTQELAVSMVKGKKIADTMGMNLSADAKSVAKDGPFTAKGCTDGCNACIAAEEDGTIHIQASIDAAEANITSAASASTSASLDGRRPGTTTTTVSMLEIPSPGESAASVIWVSAAMLAVGAVVLLTIKHQQMKSREGYVRVP